MASSIGIKTALKITFINKATNTIIQAKILDQWLKDFPFKVTSFTLQQFRQRLLLQEKVYKREKSN